MEGVASSSTEICVATYVAKRTLGSKVTTRLMDEGMQRTGWGISRKKAARDYEKEE